MSYPHIIRLQRHIVAVVPARERIKSNVIHYHAVGVPLHLGIVIVHLRHKVFYIDIYIKILLEIMHITLLKLQKEEHQNRIVLQVNFVETLY